MSRFFPRRVRTTFAALLVLFAAYACVDAPYGPDSVEAPGTLVVAPALSLVAPSGPALTAEQSNALAEAFDLVNQFRMEVRRQSTGALVLDTLIAVSPGQDAYDLSANVNASVEELFLVTLTALQGDKELFKAESIPVTAVPTAAANSARPPAGVSVPLTYSGPGATATSVEVDPGQVVVGVGGTVQMGAKVLDAQGAVVSDVPVAWTSATAGVATVGSSGMVTGAGSGVTRVSVTTPTGLQATAEVYVAGGTLAYVEGGNVMVRAPAGGDAVARSSGGGASGPVWGADGASLLYSEGGQVVRAGDATSLFEGSWPTVSPDGAKVAAERGGQVWFANEDGSNPTEGPSGTTPAWTGERTLVVAGGSIERVGVDGSGRTTLVPGSVGYPAMSAGGVLAWVDGGALKVGSGATLATDVTGRPSWSPDGVFLVVPGSAGMMLVPADGEAPPLALPGLSGATDPAWQPGAGATPAAVPAVTGLDPDPPLPDRTVEVLGSGFDDIIPANTKIFWPTPDGSTATEITAVTPTTITTVVPRSVVDGQIRVETRAGNGTFALMPTVGAIDIRTVTSSDYGVPGLEATVYDADGTQVAAGATDDDGDFFVSGLDPGTYRVDVVPPTGFGFNGARSRTFALGTETVLVELPLIPIVQSVVANPDNPTLAVGQQVAVDLQALDINGHPVTSFTRTFWGPVGGSLGAGGSGLSGVLAGVYPSTVGGAHYGVAFDDAFFTLDATVTSHIEGTVTDEGPVSGVTVELEDGSENALASSTTNANGRYMFSGLPAGVYMVRVVPAGEGTPYPAVANVNLGPANPTATADFTLSGAPAGAAGDVIVFGDINIWDGSHFSLAGNQTLTQNLVTNGDRTRIVWYTGHDSWLGPGYDPYSYFGTTTSFIVNTLDQTLDVVSVGTTGGLSIPADAASFWIWLPQDPFDAHDIGVIQTYLQGGGRVVLIGENDIGTFDLANQRVGEIMAALGSSATYVAACLSGTSTATADPLMTGVAGVSHGCTSSFTLGSGDVPLAQIGGTSVVIRLRLSGGQGGSPPRAPSIIAPAMLVEPRDSLPGNLDPSTKRPWAKGARESAGVVKRSP